MKINRFLYVIISLLMLFLSGCQTSDKLIELEGKSDHWKAEFIVTKRTEYNGQYSQPKYIMETFIKCSDKSLVVFNGSYEISIANRHTLSGKMSSPEGKKSATFSSVTEQHFTPESNDEIIVKINWNGDQEENIVMKVK